MANVVSVIVTYNGEKWIRKCLQSLLDSSCKTQVIVVDNRSTDGTVAIVRNEYPSVQVVVNDHNLGFGQANNTGMKTALSQGADHVFLLNQDAWVSHDTIAMLVYAQKANPVFGVLSPVHLNGTGSAVDFNFLQYLAQSDVAGFMENVLLKKKTPVFIETGFINAAAWLISADCLRKVGGFDPVFFHYGEDRNYLHRVLYYDFKIAVLTTAFIFHDREGRDASGALEPAIVFRNEWLNFLAYACDIRHKGYKRILIKRSIRHFLLSAGCLFSFRQAGYRHNIGMTLKIIRSARSIGKSRQQALSAKPMLYL